MKQKILFVSMLLLSMAAASFGQAPKPDRQARTSLASDKQTQGMQQRKKSPLLLPHAARNAETRRSTILRAAQESKLLLDSVVSVFGEEIMKTAYVYNAAGKLIFETDYEWNDNTEQWEEEYQTGYDNRGNRILSMYRDGSYGYKTEYACDYLNWQTLEASYEWQNGQWIYKGKTLTSYTDNADSYVETILKYEWNNNEYPYEMLKNTYSGQRQMLSNDDGNEEFDVHDEFEFPALPTPEKPFPANLVAEENRGGYDNDNGVFNYGSKREYTSVVDGYIREYKDYDWDKNSNAMVYEITTKYDYTFDAQGLLTSVMRYYNSVENSDWVLDEESYTYSYTKDGNGNVLSWTQASQQEDYVTRKVEYTYDAQNRALTAIDYRYDYETQHLVKEQSYERNFDAGGNLILSALTYWNNDEWDSKYIYAYDAAGRQTMYSYIYKTSEGNVSVYGYKYEYAFDANGNRILEIEYNYDAATQTFVPNYKSEYTFGNVPIIGVFGNEKEDYQYNPLTGKESDWEGNDWVLKEEYECEWTFDAYNNPLTVSVLSKEGDQWILDESITWYYSQHNLSGISVPATVKDLHVRISNGELWIENAALKEGDTVQIFNIAGRKTIESKQRNGQSIAVSHLPKGVYFVNVNGKTVKIIKN
jgi:hypothetical protein